MNVHVKKNAQRERSATLCEQFYSCNESSVSAETNLFTLTLLRYEGSKVPQFDRKLFVFSVSFSTKTVFR